MLFLMSDTPFHDVRFVLPSGPPPSTMTFAWAVAQSIQAFMPWASRALRLASSSLSQPDLSRASAVPMKTAMNFFISVSPLFRIG